MLPHHENLYPWSFNNIWSSISGKQAIAWIVGHIIEPLTVFISKIQPEKHRFNNNVYCKLQSIQKEATEGWICGFDKILLLNSKNKSIKWIYLWTRWATHEQPAQLQQVGRFLLNCTQIDGLGVLTTCTANLAIVWFRLGPSPEVVVRNDWLMLVWIISSSHVVYIHKVALTRDSTQVQLEEHLEMLCE